MTHGEPPSDDSGNPRRPPADLDGDRFARVLRFEIPWDGILDCSGECVYGEPRPLAPVVPIATCRELRLRTVKD